MTTYQYTVIEKMTYRISIVVCIAAVIVGIVMVYLNANVADNIKMLDVVIGDLAIDNVTDYMLEQRRNKLYTTYGENKTFMLLCGIVAVFSGMVAYVAHKHEQNR